ncbi:MAG: hypothetical protein JXJ04_18500 [Spirochaetales bacterium]|nr:hypothetical protein [Spirochaetales bacterium]
MRFISFLLLFLCICTFMGFSYTLTNKKDLERIKAFYTEKEKSYKNEMEQYRQTIRDKSGKDVRGFPAGSKEYKHYSKLEQQYFKAMLNLEGVTKSLEKRTDSLWYVLEETVKLSAVELGAIVSESCTLINLKKIITGDWAGIISSVIDAKLKYEIQGQVQKAFGNGYPEIEAYMVNLVQPEVPLATQWKEEMKGEIASSLKDKLLAKLEAIRSNLTAANAKKLAAREVMKLGAALDFGSFAADLYNKYTIWTTCKPSVDAAIDAIKKTKQKEEKLRKGKITWVLAFQIFTGKAEFTKPEKDNPKTADNIDTGKVSGKDSSKDSHKDSGEKKDTGEISGNENTSTDKETEAYWKLIAVETKKSPELQYDEWTTIKHSLSAGSMYIYFKNEFYSPPDKPCTIAKMNLSCSKPPEKLKSGDSLKLNVNYSYSCQVISPAVWDNCRNLWAEALISYIFDKKAVTSLVEWTRLGIGDMYKNDWVSYPHTIAAGYEGAVMGIEIFGTDGGSFWLTFDYVYEWVE